MATRSLNVVITGDSKPLGVASRQADRHMGGVEKSAGRMGKAVKSGFAIAAVGTGALVVGLKKSVDAAVDAEKSQAKLKAQLNASGASYRAHAKEIDAVIQKHSRLAGVDDEDLQDAFTGLVRSTGSVKTAMKDMGLVTDLMRGKNLTAAKAGDVLAKVHNGNVTALKRYGIAIDPVTKAQDKLKESNKDATKEQVDAAKASDKAATAQKGIAELQKRFGGQAEAYGKTAAGAQDRFAVAMENVQEKLGAKLLPVLATVANAVSKFLSQIDRGTGAGGRFASTVSGAFEKVKGAVSAALPVVSAIFERIKDAVTSALPTAAAAFQTLRSAVASVVSTITGLVTGFQEGKGGAVAIGSVIAGVTAAFAAYKVAMIATATATKVVAAVTKAYAGVQAALNVVMTANPIGLVVLALVALGAGLVVAYKKSETFRNVVNTAWSAIRDTTMTVLNWLVPAVKTAFGVVADVVGVAVKVVRGYVKVYAKAAGGIVDAIIGAFNFLKALPGKVAGFFSDTTKKIRDWVGNFTSAALSLGKGIGKGILSGLGNLGHLLLTKVTDALKFVVDHLPGPAGAVGSAIKNIFGDGIGKAAKSAAGGAMPTGTFGGSLMGARPSMAPFAAAASRFGLGVSSGRRPGSITSSGNVSYHSTGEAIDVAGNPQGMLGFFRQMKSKFGSRLAELIYTPGGAGVRNGQPHTYSGQVAADHFDHVHVAYDTGAPGVGDGLGKFDTTAYGPPWNAMNGTGVTATGVDLRPAKKAYGVAVDPRVIKLGTKLKITPNPFGYSGPFTAFDTGGAIKGNRIDFYDWRGRKSQMGWGHKNVTVSTYNSGSSKSKSPPKSGGSSKPTYSSAKDAPESPIYSGEGTADPFGDNIQARAQGFLDAQRPSKGKGPTKGFPIGFTPPDPVDAPVGPTLNDFAEARVAAARLTAGTEDDLGALGNLLQLRQKEMDAALSDSDPRNDAAAIDAFLSVRDSIDSLRNSMDETNRLQAQRDDLNKTIAENQKKILALAGQGPQIVAAVVAAVSGGIGGQVGLGLQTPGYAGSVARY